MGQRRSATARIITENPFEFALAVILLLASARTILRGSSMSGAIDARLEAFLSALWQVGIVLAALFVLGGLFGQVMVNPASLGTVARFRVLERAGCILMTGTCTVYLVVIAWTSPRDAWFAMAFSFSIAIAFGIRAWVLRKRNRTVLDGLRSVTGAED